MTGQEVVCDWCDEPPVVSNPVLGTLCAGCLELAVADADLDTDGSNPGHYTLEHTTPVCFTAVDDTAAVNRMDTYLAGLPQTPLLRSARMLLARGRVEDGDTSLIDHGGTFVTVDDTDGYVLLARCSCHGP